METKQRNLELIAFFGAMSLFLATLEYLFPKPVPFFRLGLANIPILIALRLFRARSVLILAFLKVAGQGLINGTLASYVFLFSLAGTMASVGMMLAITRLCGRRISLIGISIMGALASNVMQIWLSLSFIFGPNARVIAPFLLLFGVAGGLIVGLFAELFYRRSTWLARIAGD